MAASPQNPATTRLSETRGPRPAWPTPRAERAVETPAPGWGLAVSMGYPRLAGGPARPARAPVAIPKL